MRQRAHLSLQQIAIQMKIQASNEGKAMFTLLNGLTLKLEKFQDGWKLHLHRQERRISKREYKLITKAFFNRQVKHARCGGDNSIVVSTVK